ncbi:hypothetical protein J7L49_06915 [Candidatus Bathyarchaeota archaeon]|nr:hypothetical protein [Candidatus Bathyarchaeota archaeon]
MEKGKLNLEKNKEVILNFGLIAVGKLKEIEKLQKFISEKMKELRVVYCTVSARKLYLVKNFGE